MKFVPWLLLAAVVLVPQLLWPSLTPGRVLWSLFLAACGLAAYIVFSVLRAVFAAME